jgi:GntR family transcriptional regulator, transcriptional repressor for pyruvate dehydrogenase complex
MPDEDLAARFRTWLRDADLKPGDRIPGEIELAERFAVPRATVREVIMHFCHLGVLERVRNRGTTVCAVSPERLGDDIALCFGLAGFTATDLKETRLLVETAIANLACRRLQPADAVRLRSLIDAMAAERDPEAADTLDRDFHLALVAACGNPCLSMFSGVIQTLFRRQHRGPWLSKTAAAKSVADHRAILAALEAGDAALVQRLLTAHIEPT